MRVLLVTPSFGTFGGIQAFMIALARDLQQLEDMEPHLCLKLVRGARVETSLLSTLQASGVPFSFVGRASPGLLEQVRLADIVHCQTPAIDVAVLSRLLRKPLVTTIHNHRSPLTPPVRQILHRWAMKLASRRWYQSDFVKASWTGASGDPLAERMPGQADLPTTIVSPSERTGFIFIARWIENKGLRTLIRAYAQAKLDNRQHPLTLVGDGPLRPEVERLLTELDLDGFVERPGFVNEEERNRLIASARWMVTPSNTREDLGLTPIEARHVGVPCIVTRDGGLPEAAGRHSLVCEPGDIQGLTALLEQAASMPEPEYRALAEASRAELRQWLRPLTVHADRYREVVRESRR